MGYTSISWHSSLYIHHHSYLILLFSHYGTQFYDIFEKDLVLNCNSHRSHSLLSRYHSSLIFAHILGISLIFALRNQFLPNMYVVVLIGLSYIVLQYPFSILLGGVIYNLLTTLTVIASNNFTRDWKYAFLTLLMSLLVLFFNYTLEYFTRKAYVKEIKLKVDLQRAKNEIEKTETLITNSVPILIARQYFYGRNPLADKFPACTVVAIEIQVDTSQLIPLYSVIDPIENIVLINEVLGVLDSVALKYDLFVAKASATEYICVSGLPQPISGHARKAVDFSLEVMNEIKLFTNPQVNKKKVSMVFMFRMATL
jgi:hypothetical protein